jgi:hypothetical protein
MILDNGQLRLEILPEFGAKVTSLVDLRTGHEWIAPGPSATQAPGLDADPTEHMCSGWFECFPSISGGLHPSLDWSAVKLADHGEIWSRPWRSAADSPLSVVMSIDGARLPYTFERRITLDGRGFHADYKVTTLSEVPVPCMWAMHLLANVSPGIELSLPVDAPLRIDFVHPSSSEAHELQARWPWLPTTTGLRDLSRLHSTSSQFATKVFAHDFEAGQARLLDPDTATFLELRFTPHVIPCFGIWINQGGWPSTDSGLYQLGLEPATGCSDDLATALRNRETTVAIDRPLAWRITMTFKHAENVDC